MKVLLVEDDKNLGYLLKENLDNKGYTTALCKDGEEGWSTFIKDKYSICILDIMLPKKDGFSLARQIRNQDERIPIIFLTAKTMDEDKITGFELGCDDYITKPFSAQELLLRIKAVLKRTSAAESFSEQLPEFKLGKFTFNYFSRQLTDQDQSRRLSSKEAELLKIFCTNQGMLLNRNYILLQVWGSDDYFAARSMDVYLTRLRKFLRQDSKIEIQNVHGTGFKLVVNQIN